VDIEEGRSTNLDFGVIENLVESGLGSFDVLGLEGGGGDVGSS
jgi:hypothetical protein